MHKLIFAVVTSAVLTGCAMDGGPSTYPPEIVSVTGTTNQWYNDRFWPPVYPGQPFPPQIMDGSSQD